MHLAEQIEAYILSLPEQKQIEILQLHKLILQVSDGVKLWFDNGLDANNKVVNNPTIGYGSYTIKYANGKTREFFQIGLSANTTGISVYIMGLKDKNYLAQTFGKEIGKASVTGYCIKFKNLKDINVKILESAIRYRLTLIDEN